MVTPISILPIVAVLVSSSIVVLSKSSDHRNSTYQIVYDGPNKPEVEPTRHEKTFPGVPAEVSNVFIAGVATLTQMANATSHTLQSLASRKVNGISNLFGSIMGVKTPASPPPPSFETEFQGSQWPKPVVPQGSYALRRPRETTTTNVEPYTEITLRTSKPDTLFEDSIEYAEDEEAITETVVKRSTLRTYKYKSPDRFYNRWRNPSTTRRTVTKKPTAITLSAIKEMLPSTQRSTPLPYQPVSFPHFQTTTFPLDTETSLDQSSQDLANAFALALNNFGDAGSNKPVIHTPLESGENEIKSTTTEFTTQLVSISTPTTNVPTTTRRLGWKVKNKTLSSGMGHTEANVDLSILFQSIAGLGHKGNQGEENVYPSIPIPAGDETTEADESVYWERFSSTERSSNNSSAQQQTFLNNATTKGPFKITENSTNMKDLTETSVKPSSQSSSGGWQIPMRFPISNVNYNLVLPPESNKNEKFPIKQHPLNVNVLAPVFIKNLHFLNLREEERRATEEVDYYDDEQNEWNGLIK